MKIFTLLTLFIISFSSYAENMFSSKSYLDSLRNTPKYDDEMLEIGGTVMSRGKLNGLSGMKDRPDCFYLQSSNSSIMDNVAFQTATNIGVLASAVAIFTADQDKQKHALAGIVAALAGKKFCEWVKRDSKNDNRFICALTGAAFAAIAGVVKELYDSTGRGNVDVWDAVYTAIPASFISFSISY